MKKMYDKKKVQVGKDQEKAQSEKDSHSKNRGGKTKLTIRYLYHVNISYEVVDEKLLVMKKMYDQKATIRKRRNQKKIPTPKNRGWKNK